LGVDPVRAARFADTMAVFTRDKGFHLSHLINGYDWDSLGEVVVVDIGGSTGHVGIALASNFSSLQVIVQDLEVTIAGTEPSLPSEVSSRVRFMAHNFFEEQPIVADVYFLRWILHNWSDKYCIQILRYLIPSLRPGARIIVNDICLPEAMTIPHWQEMQLRTMDLDMLTLFNARERDEDDWKVLFQRADPRFKFQGIKQPKGSTLALILATWVK